MTGRGHNATAQGRGGRNMKDNKETATIGTGIAWIFYAGCAAFVVAVAKDSWVAFAVGVSFWILAAGILVVCATARE